MASYLLRTLRLLAHLQHADDVVRQLKQQIDETQALLDHVLKHTPPSPTPHPHAN